MKKLLHYFNQKIIKTDLAVALEEHP